MIGDNNRKYRMQALTKRVVSVLLIVGMIAAILPNLAKDDVAYADDAAGTVTRGVINSLGQLPQYDAANPGQFKNPNAARGTAERPFVILEVVPYEEYAEIGYMISGCEPVKVEEMFGRRDLKKIESIGAASVVQQSGYFFSDEPEGDKAKYDGSCDWRSSASVTGYYELVEDGIGKFKRETFENAEDGSLETRIVKAEGGNLIWHSVNNFEPEYSAEKFSDSLEKELSNIGDRIYTTRTATGEDQALYTYEYYSYQNKELFLSKTLGLEGDAADNYSIVVKTITPEELNAAATYNETTKTWFNTWVSYADLIYVYPQTHMSDFQSVWQKYNRLGHEAVAGASSDKKGFTGAKELSWGTVYSIYEKITADTNYAGLILDKRIYEVDKKTITMQVYDWNLKKVQRYNNGSWQNVTYQYQGSNNNLYKLGVMFASMDATLFKNLYLSGTSPYITKDGVFTLQEGDAATYWTGATFLLLENGSNVDMVSTIWNDIDLWNRYHTAMNITENRFQPWVSGHVYTYNGDNSLTQQYLTQSVPTGVFQEFADFINENGTVDETGSAKSVDAVRYILGMQVNGSGEDDGKVLRVLDLEPSVGLDANSQPDWKLTETYIRMLVPSFTGKIEITHQTTAEFNGKTEDLNSTYQMIFLGLDFSAYNTRSQNFQLKDGTWTGNQLFPDWNDNSMDGLIYFHTGDSMVSTESARSDRSSVKFLWSVAANRKVESTDMRFPGNDISERKQNELNEFVKAGYPVVAEKYLYNLEKAFIDEKANIYEFVRSHTAAGGGTGVYSSSDAIGISNAVSAYTNVVTFTQLPPQYDGTTKNSSTWEIANKIYLPESGGQSYLPFGFSVSQEGYSYRIFVDSDRNSKFTTDEIVYSKAAGASNYYAYRVAASMVGLVQWKIEVYRNDNEAIHYIETGCSAVKNKSGSRKEIKVLQIMPKSGSYQGALNLEESDLFKKYYQNLADYQVTVKSITLSEFEGYFSGKNFSYDMSKEIGSDNPKNENLLGGDLSKYNMIIVGFGDTYGNQNLSEDAAEYLQYYTALGKSILYTHDLTSMYNSGDIFGSTANAMLRDVMGMNRYQAVNSTLSTEKRNQMIAYQSIHAGDYDTMNTSSGEERHGFTYYAMKRLGWASNQNNVNSGNKVPYRYMITQPGKTTAVCNVNNTTKTTGFNNNNDLTGRASKLNEGQVTVYPYKIDDSLKIADTHGQWYQLNMEDEDVTVWYTLSDVPAGSKETGWQRGWDGNDANNGDGTALTYAVSPNDAANNYYIYSKGNVFYSGVGHSTVNSDMEAKLFVNTMIAAYRASYEPPVIEVTNGEAVLTGIQNYGIEILQEFDSNNFAVIDVNDNWQTAEAFASGDTYTVKFQPVEFNLVATNLECIISYPNGGTPIYVNTITRLSDGAVLTADPVTHKFTGLQNGAEYSFEYPKIYLSGGGAGGNPLRVVEFEIKNDRSASTNVTTLNLREQPLFQLD